MNIDRVETADGKRVLVRERVDEGAPRSDIRIVLNWRDELRAKIP